jgi:carboxypeptidase Taq
MSAIENLKQRMADVITLASVGAVLDWDHQTYMPTGGVMRRAGQLALINKLRHEMFVSAETERLLTLAESEAQDFDPDSDDAAYLRVARREFNKKAKLPGTLIEEIAQTATIAHEDWAAARAASDYSRFAPSLQKTLDLQRRVADLLGYKSERYAPSVRSIETAASCLSKSDCTKWARCR